MDMYMRVFFLDTFKDLAIIKNIPIPDKPPLDTNLGCIEIHCHFCFFKDFRDCHDISVILPECAEFAGANAPVRKIDIPVYDKCNSVPDCFFSKPVGKREKEIGILIKFQCIIQSALTCPDAFTEFVMNS
jgi:hypothetical protein